MARSTKATCQKCRTAAPDYEIIHVMGEAGTRRLCLRCLNTELAELQGIENFEHLSFDPVKVVDCDGSLHEFRFRTRLSVTGMVMEGREFRRGRPAGYEFEVISEANSDQMVLLGRLLNKIRRALASKHLRMEKYGLSIANQVVRGRIDCDLSETSGLPLLVVDGVAITWEQFGRMLMTFEGWQFKLDIRDMTEEV